MPVLRMLLGIFKLYVLGIAPPLPQVMVVTSAGKRPPLSTIEADTALREACGWDPQSGATPDVVKLYEHCNAMRLRKMEADFADRTRSIDSAYSKVATFFTMLAFIFGALAPIFGQPHHGARAVLANQALWVLTASLVIMAWSLMPRAKVIDNWTRFCYLREWLWHRDHLVQAVRRLQYIGFALSITGIVMTTIALTH